MCVFASVDMCLSYKQNDVRFLDSLTVSASCVPVCGMVPFLIKGKKCAGTGVRGTNDPGMQFAHCCVYVFKFHFNFFNLKRAFWKPVLCPKQPF